MNLLAADGLSAGYGGVVVVRDTSLAVRAGEVVALLGPNGAGKTTFLLTLAGLLPPIAGSITFDGKPLPKSSHLVTRRGLVLVPDDRALFPKLTVAEHLAIAGRRHGGTSGDVLDLFPALAERTRQTAGSLSGGEQQMLAMARALIQQPRVLLVDEMSMGLAPKIVEDLLQRVHEISKLTGVGVLLVEQHVGMALRVADRAVVLVHGEVAVEAPAAELAADPRRIDAAYLGIEPSRSS